ncbi:hypothetical protein MFRU_008g02700 [Monilinia fructicola]|uniref:Hypersensitive response-inducing protein n=1 Tax=Monilinia fructicola TaxID=38448 RepID=A0A5M9JB48_MONFR|nr:hypothetical protein EYC84_010656 [Monilinia fructicola]KAG4031917.1 hypothetical protein MFRU_008g02700 [Monilinia fructicola]
MQFSTAVLSAITVAVASAATIGQRDTVFKVSAFSAGCIPHSTQCLYSFNVIQPGTMETTGVNCSALVPATSSGDLPDLAKWQGKCGESSRTFWLTHKDNGVEFTVSQPVTPSSNQTGSYLLPSSDFTKTETSINSIQSYNGPTSFNLS